MRKVIILTFLCHFLFISCEILQELPIGEYLGDPSKLAISKLLKEKPPVTTNFKDDVVSEVASLDDFNPDKEQFQDANLLPRTENGSYILKEGLFFLETKSYCIKAGTYGPSKGDGYVYAPLKGPKANIIRKVIENSYDKEDISQQEIQQLIWAIIANTKYSNMADRHQDTANKVLNLVEIQQLDGGLWALVPNNVKQKAIQAVSPALQKIYQTEDKMRGLLSNVNSSYQQMEKLAVLSGVPTWGEEIRPTPSGRWAYNPNGFFIRMFPRGYQQTRVELYVPHFTDISLDKQDRIKRISVDNTIELEFEYTNLSDQRPTNISTFSLKDGFMKPKTPIQGGSYVSTSIGTTPFKSMLSKLNLEVNIELQSKINQLLALEKLISSSSLDQKYKQTIVNGVKKAQIGLIYNRIKELDTPKKVKVLNEKINQISAINQLNFNMKTTVSTNQIIYNAIENVSVPAFTSKQRIAVSPKKTSPKHEKKCTKPTFDHGKQKHSVIVSGIELKGSKEFILLVNEALNTVKNDAPKYFYRYLSPKNKTANYPLVGIGIGCHRDVHTIDANRFIRLSIPNLAKYNEFKNTPEVLASIMIHEAVHVHQAYAFMSTIGYGSYEEFLKYFGRDKATQGSFEVAASEKQLEYLGIALKKYPSSSSHYKYINRMIDHVEKYKHQHTH